MKDGRNDERERTKEGKTGEEEEEGLRECKRRRRMGLIGIDMKCSFDIKR